MEKKMEEHIDMYLELLNRIKSTTMTVSSWWA